MAQLKRYLKDGTLHYSFSGPLWFPQHGNKSWKPGLAAYQWHIRRGQQHGSRDGPRQVGRLPRRADRLYRLLRGTVRLSTWCTPSLWLLSTGNHGHSRRTRCQDGHNQRAVCGRRSGRPDASPSGKVSSRLAARALLLQLPSALCYDEGVSAVRDLSLTLEKESGTVGYLEGWGRESLEIGATSFHGPMQFTQSVSGKVPAPSTMPRIGCCGCKFRRGQARSSCWISRSVSRRTTRTSFGGRSNRNSCIGSTAVHSAERFICLTVKRCGRSRRSRLSLVPRTSGRFTASETRRAPGTLCQLHRSPCFRHRHEGPLCDAGATPWGMLLACPSAVSLRHGQAGSLPHDAGRPLA